MNRKGAFSRTLPKVLIVSVIACQLGGCASWSKAPPSCDGSVRRPLNRSLWDWESGTPLAVPEQAAPPAASAHSSGRGMPILQRRLRGFTLPATTSTSPPPTTLAARRREMVGPDDLKTYFDNARRWEQDLLLSAHRSRRTAWFIAAGACALAIISVGAVAALAPLKTVEPFVIRVDNATGIIDTVSALTATPARYDEAVTKYFLGRYVRARGLQLSRSGDELPGDLFALWAGRAGPFRGVVPGLKPGESASRPRTVWGRLDSDQGNFAPGRQCGLRSFHEGKPKGEETRITHWVSTLTFSYANAPMSSADRLVNPLGFQVSEYRADPEVVP